MHPVAMKSVVLVTKMARKAVGWVKEGKQSEGQNERGQGRGDSR